MDLRTYLRRELKRRQQRNRRYSLRAFASSLGVSHSTLSRLSGSRFRLTSRMAQRLGTRLGLSPKETNAVLLHETAVSIIALLNHPGFRADCRWFAMMTGLPLDAINVGLHHLLYTRRISMPSPHRWQLEES